MSSKNLNVRIEIMRSIAIFAFVDPEGLEENFGKILPYIDAAINEGSNDMLMQALMILNYVF